MNISSYLKLIENDDIKLGELLNAWAEESGLDKHQILHAILAMLEASAIYLSDAQNNQHQSHIYRSLKNIQSTYKNSLHWHADSDLEQLFISKQKIGKLLAEHQVTPPHVLRITPTGERSKHKPESTLATPSVLSHSPLRRKTDHQLIRVPTPADLKWHEITITFISHEAIKFQARDLEKRLHFAEIGFKDGRKGDIPDTRWAILRELAARQGTIAWGDINQRHSEKMKSAVKDIRKRLKSMTGLTSDPFYPYRQCKAYKTRFQIRDMTI